MKRKVIREKQYRLPEEMYLGFKSVAFTLCVKDNKMLFIEDEIFHVFEQELLSSLSAHKCSAYIYLFMPDHLHMIIKGEESNSNTKKTVELFKQKTGFWLSKFHNQYKWQKDYYDHLIRSNEDIENQIRYILNNPVRACIVENWKEYKLSGSTIYNLDEFIETY